jgi:hypothetical protein
MGADSKGYPQKALAIRVPASAARLAPPKDNAYILGNPTRNVKPENMHKAAKNTP